MIVVFEVLIYLALIVAFPHLFVWLTCAALVALALFVVVRAAIRSALTNSPL